MGANVSREISINEEENQSSMPRSATLPIGFKNLGEKLSWSGTLPRGLGLDSSFTVKLTKSKKLEENSSELNETKVEIVKKMEDEKESEENQEEQEQKEETIQEYIEALLIKVLEDALASIGDKKMKKSSTLPAGFRGLTKNHSFGRRIRQSIRKLVPAKKQIVEEENEETKEHEVQEGTEKVVEQTETVQEDTEPVEEVEVTETSVKERTFTIPMKKFDLQSKKRQIQSTLKKLVTRTKKPKKESIDLINSILDDIIKEIEGEEEVTEENNEEDKVIETQEEEKHEEKAVDVSEEHEEKPVDVPEEKVELAEETVPQGVLDKSND